MTQSAKRVLIEGFYRAFARRDVDTIAPFLDEAAEWTISGPVDLLTFCGRYRGREAVLDMIARQIPAVMDIATFTPELLLVDGERAATLVRVRGCGRTDGRTISYRAANFMRFRDGRILENLAVIDSFDAVEQVLGHPLAVHEAPALDDESDVIAV